MDPQLGQLVVAYDPGTGSMGIAARHIHPDLPSSWTIEPDIVYLDESEDDVNPDIKSIAVFIYKCNDNWEIIFGKAVSEVLRNNPDLQDQSLEFYKLALHPKFSEFIEVEHVNKVLDAARDHGKLQEFYSDLLEKLIKLVRKFYKGQPSPLNIADKNAYFDNIPISLEICVPAMWEDAQLGVMRNAARQAGVEKVELREEPLCSAVMCTHKLLKVNAIEVGQCLLVVDCGAGTLDISTTRLDQVPSDDQEMVLKRIGICSGNEAGSHMLNHMLSAYITSGQCPEVPNIKTLSKAMNITEHDFLRQASHNFDQVKKNFPGNARFHAVEVYGGENAAKEHHTIHLPHTLVLRWYTAWVATATPLLQEHIDDITKWAADHNIHLNFRYAIFSGGGMRCKLLAQAMEGVLLELQYNFEIQYTRSRLPCAQGALMYQAFREDTLPRNMHFFVGRDEYYVESLHGEKAKRKNSTWVKKATKIAMDRITRIMDFNDGTPSGQQVIQMTHYVEDGEAAGRMHTYLYWSEKEVEDHAPLKDRAGNLLKGIRRFPLVWADLPDLSQEGFKSQERGGIGGRHFKVKTWVGLTFRDDKLILTVKIMRPGYQFPWKSDGSIRLKKNSQKRRPISRTWASVGNRDVFLTKEVEVWAKDSSHFVTSSTGTCISRGDHIPDGMEVDTEEGSEDENMENVEEDGENKVMEEGEDEVMGDGEDGSGDGEDDSEDGEDDSEDSEDDD